jgi:hypothetical protein
MIGCAAARPTAASQSRSSPGQGWGLLALGAMVAVFAVAVSFAGSAAALEWSEPVLADAHVPRAAHSTGITTVSCPVGVVVRRV